MKTLINNCFVSFIFFQSTNGKLDSPTWKKSPSGVRSQDVEDRYNYYNNNNIIITLFKSQIKFTS